MQNLFSRCFWNIIDRVAYASALARLTVYDWICGPYPETEADRIRAEQMRRMVEGGRALGLLDEGEDEVTLAWHNAQRQFRRR